MDAVQMLREAADQLEEERGIARRLLAACERLLALTTPVQTGGVRLPDSDQARHALDLIKTAVADATQ